MKRPGIQYSIMNPTGNITALVESEVKRDRQASCARSIMQKHPEVEQVGFMRFGSHESGGESCLPELRMAGGEFCGNASMCAAALCVLRAAGMDPDGCAEGGPERTVFLKVSGSAEAVKVRLRREEDGSFSAGVLMPPAKDVGYGTFSCGGLKGELPVVRMEGISHVMIERGSPFFALLENTSSAARAVREFCGTLGADGLGLMFLEEKSDGLYLTPLVYIPGSDTIFWEHSCASGSAAAGMYMARKHGGPVDLAFREPGGTLRAAAGGEDGETWLYGRTHLVSEHIL